MAVFEDSQPTQEEASLKVHRSRSVRRVEVTTDGRNLVSHAGTAMLSELADRTGLTRPMSEAMAGCGISWHTHDPGVVLTHSRRHRRRGRLPERLRHPRSGSELFGDVASITTAWRAVKATAAPELREIPNGGGGRTRGRVGGGATRRHHDRLRRGEKFLLFRATPPAPSPKNTPPTSHD